MPQQLPCLAELSHSEKDVLIVRLLGELDALRVVVEDLQRRVASLETENKKLRSENQKLKAERKKVGRATRTSWP